MQAAVCAELGPPSTVALQQVAVPQPRAGEVRVRIGAAAVNYTDVLLVAGGYQVKLEPPFVPGSEFAGVVDALGEGVEASDGARFLGIGNEVSGTTHVGSFAEYVVVPAAALSAKPDALDMGQAAAFSVAYRTAYHTLRSVANVTAGETVLVLGAGGGVGLAAVQIAKALGCRVIAAASSRTKRSAAVDAGADEAVDYTADDFRARLREVAPTLDVVVDPVGGTATELSLRSMSPGGRLVTVGYASGSIPSIPLNLVLLKDVAILGFEVRTWVDRYAELAARDNAELDELVRQGKVVPFVSRRFPLARTAVALEHVAAREAVGKIVIDTHLEETS